MRSKPKRKRRCQTCGGATFVCAPCNGIVTGKVADEIRHELLHGTPDTPERIAMIKRADEVYRRSQASGEPQA